MTFSPYRIRSAETWARARDDYLAGMTAEAVCRRHDLGLSAFRKRARKHGWRRADHADPAGEETLAIYDDLGTDDEVGTARRRYFQALEQGRSVEALRWRRLWKALDAERNALLAEIYPGLTHGQRIVQSEADRREVEAEGDEVDEALSLGDPVPPQLSGPDDPGENVHHVHPVFSGAHFPETQPAPEDALRNRTRAAP